MLVQNSLDATDLTQTLNSLDATDGTYTLNSLQLADLTQTQNSLYLADLTHTALSRHGRFDTAPVPVLEVSTLPRSFGNLCFFTGGT